MKRFVFITIMCLFTIIVVSAQDSNGQGNPDNSGTARFQPRTLCQPFYSGVGMVFYVLFDSEAGDIEQTGDLYWTDVPSCDSTSYSGGLYGWTIAYAPHGPRQAEELCGGTPIRRHSAKVYICEGL